MVSETGSIVFVSRVIFCQYQDQGPDKTLDQLNAEGKRMLRKGRSRSGMITPVGILHERGRNEPWYIAMERLILILSIALYWAVSLGLSHEKHY